MAERLNRGEIWLYTFPRPNKRRPVLILTRQEVIPLLSTVMVFVSLLQTVSSLALLRSGRGELVSRLDRWSKPVYPLLLLFVLFVSFG